VTLAASYTIRHVRAADRIEAVRVFYEAHVDDHVWPRTLEELSQLAEDWCLFEAVTEDGSIAATCYAKQDEEPPDTPRAGKARWEIGGLYAVQACRGTGLAETLATIAIIALYVQNDPQDERLIGHVHEFNTKPRKLLERLGFAHDGQEIPPSHVVPPNMKRNEKGEVVGHLFVFQLKHLAALADWLETYAGVLPSGAAVRLDVSMYTKDRSRTAEALRDIAKRP